MQFFFEQNQKNSYIFASKYVIVNFGRTEISKNVTEILN
jgi:hypothetical protein